MSRPIGNRSLDCKCNLGRAAESTEAMVGLLSPKQRPLRTTYLRCRLGRSVRSTLEMRFCLRDSATKYYFSLEHERKNQPRVNNYNMRHVSPFYRGGFGSRHLYMYTHFFSCRGLFHRSRHHRNSVLKQIFCANHMALFISLHVSLCFYRFRSFHNLFVDLSTEVRRWWQHNSRWNQEYFRL